MVAGDNANRTLKQNIVDIIHRTGGWFNFLQNSKDIWVTSAAEDIKDLTDAGRRGHLTLPRQLLDSWPYLLFTTWYEKLAQYIVFVKTKDGVGGILVQHTSNSNDSYLIPNDRDREIGKCPSVLRWLTRDITFYRGVQLLCEESIFHKQKKKIKLMIDVMIWTTLETYLNNPWSLMALLGRVLVTLCLVLIQKETAQGRVPISFTARRNHYTDTNNQEEEISKRRSCWFDEESNWTCY